MAYPPIRDYEIQRRWNQALQATMIAGSSIEEFRNKRKHDKDLHKVLGNVAKALDKLVDLHVYSLAKTRLTTQRRIERTL